MEMSNNQPRLRPQDLANAKDLKCDECGHAYFVPVASIKLISALLSPTGKEINVPIQTFACAKCQHVNASFVPEIS